MHKADLDELTAFLLQTGQITLEELLKTQELPSEQINRIIKAIKEHETDRK